MTGAEQQWLHSYLTLLFYLFHFFTLFNQYFHLHFPTPFSTSKDDIRSLPLINSMLRNAYIKRTQIYPLSHLQNQDLCVAVFSIFYPLTSLLPHSINTCQVIHVFQSPGIMQVAKDTKVNDKQDLFFSLDNLSTLLLFLNCPM